ncbi:MAG: APC family permease [Desulfobacterota bacterium]|nr:APC family permease [Thermodesulfobacteriota bacterium]
MRRLIIGKPLGTPEYPIFHRLSLIPLLAWIGLGSDGLSSSAYGPEEAFKIITGHSYLAIFLGLATAITVFTISYAYSRIIEQFPYGGGGYVVATHTIGKHAGVISGCALLVDYMLTITVSIASCGDAIFSFLPVYLHKYKLIFCASLIFFLVILNLRGVKESILVLAPIFITFAVTHAILIGYGILSHISEVSHLVEDVKRSASQDISNIGLWGVIAIFLRAFSLGGGTYTGLEAVSNGMQIIREPKVEYGKRTMAYMATSLAITASGLLFCYYLFEIKPVQGKTLNACLSEEIFGRWTFGDSLAFLTVLSEAALLVLAAQTGFVDGPRVMANMAMDYWLPRKFVSLSERLTMQNGILLMGLSSLILLFYTHGSVSTLIVMYSINVFITFSISQFGMIRFFSKNREIDAKWKRHAAIHIFGFFVCSLILSITVYEKFEEGGWITLLITAFIISLCYLIQAHYRKVQVEMAKLSELLLDVPVSEKENREPPKKEDMTAIVLVNGYNGFGLHTFFSILKSFPNVYKNFIFVTVAEIDSGAFKGIAQIESLKKSVYASLEKYVKLARRLGYPSDHRMDLGTDVVESASELVKTLVTEYKHSTVFMGKLVFRHENPFHRILHNETAYAIQRRLHWEGIASFILPIRVSI